MSRFKAIEEKIEEGYGLILDNDYPGGCSVWLEAWELIKELFTEGIASDVFDLNDKYKWTQYPSNYVQDVEEELRNAGLEDRAYHHKRIKFCEELLLWCDEEVTSNNARISIAEAYVDLGDMSTSERLYEEWLREDPEWGWGYIGRADYYIYRLDAPDLEKAYEILDEGLLHPGLRDRRDVLERGIEYGEQSENDAKVKYYKREFHKISSARVVKVGRNEPCPCGSGKKYKKCCLP
jgi:tetratricopeptide (TPR) repeat protein